MADPRACFPERLPGPGHGAAFDLRGFHDQVLAHGSLPLATLTRELPNWVVAPV